MQHFIQRLGLVTLLLFGLLAAGFTNASNGKAPPRFDLHPRATTAQENTPATFTSRADGDPQPTYQWERQDGGGKWSPIAGATSASLSFLAVYDRDHGSLFRAVATNAKGSKSSNAARLTVTRGTVPTPFAISSQPKDQTVPQGQSAKFSVAATGATAPGFQWYVKAAGGSSYVAIAQATQADYSTPATTAADDGAMYLARVTSGTQVLDSTAAKLTVTQPTAGQWVPAGSAVLPRTFHTATLLRDGRVLVAGGWMLQGTYMQAQGTAEIYDPVTNTFSPTGNLNDGRQGHQAVLMQDGRVLVTAGWDSGGSPVTSSEIYDPQTGKFQTLGSNLITPRMHGFAFSMPDGKVLLVGGQETFKSTYVNFWGNINEWNRPIRVAQLFDPATMTVADTGSLVALGRDTTSSATQLADGRVLLAGGMIMAQYILPIADPQWRRLADAEIYDPATGTFTATTGTMKAARASHQTTLLADGTVLIAGGDLTDVATQQPIEGYTTSTEVFNPATQSFSAGTPLLQGRRGGHTMTRMASGKVLTVGGLKAGGSSYFTAADQVELLDPATGQADKSGDLARWGHATVLLQNGKVLVVGGRYLNTSLESVLFD